jgi:hypothetical protein
VLSHCPGLRGSLLFHCRDLYRDGHDRHLLPNWSDLWLGLLCQRRNVQQRRVLSYCSGVRSSLLLHR